MRITVKLYASLAEYLPPEAHANAFGLDTADASSPHQVLDRCGVPRARAHLLLVNGTYVPPAERDTQPQSGEGREDGVSKGLDKESRPGTRGP